MQYMSEEDINGSGISIDTQMAAADQKKEIIERRGFDILGRAFGILFLIMINGFVILVVGYLYVVEKHYLADNNQYIWIAIFFIS